VSYADKSTPVTASADGVSGAHNDGTAGEGDTIGADIENLIGGSAGDTLIGNDLSNVLDGSYGNDTLQGMGGADTLIGGDGTDTVSYLEKRMQ